MLTLLCMHEMNGQWKYKQITSLLHSRAVFFICYFYWRLLYMIYVVFITICVCAYRRSLGRFFPVVNFELKIDLQVNIISKLFYTNSQFLILAIYSTDITKLNERIRKSKSRETSTILSDINYLIDLVNRCISFNARLFSLKL